MGVFTQQIGLVYSVAFPTIMGLPQVVNYLRELQSGTLMSQSVGYFTALLCDEKVAKPSCIGISSSQRYHIYACLHHVVIAYILLLDYICFTLKGSCLINATGKAIII